MIIQPMLVRFSTGFMEEPDLYDSTIVLVPRHVTLDNYRIVGELTDMPRSMLNTLWTSLLVSVLQVISCTLVAYGFARFEFPLKKFWFACVVMLIIVPPQTIQTSLYMTFANFDIFGIFKTLTGKTVNLRTSVLPYALMSLTCMGLKNGLYIYILRQYFMGVPKSLEEAAFVDGCGTMHTFARIMLPDAVPTIASCFLFSFVWQWTDVFYTRNFLSSYSIYSNQLSSIVSRMSRYFAEGVGQAVIVPNGRQQQLISIGVLICCIPLIILYCFTQRTFVQSLVMTGSKE
jgi:multiple sugar transport system permease protein